MIEGFAAEVLTQRAVLMKVCIRIYIEWSDGHYQGF